MGHTAASIRRHIQERAPGELFTTRDFLSYGKRGTVDRVLFTMVHSARIIRVARGVFMKPGSPTPSVEYVARTKAEAFGKKILAHGSRAAAEIGLEVEPDPHSFSCTGRSSSFMFGTIRIRLCGLAPRKMHLEDTLVGLIIRAFWYLGKERCTQNMVYTAARHLMKPDREKLRAAAKFMPAWMTHLWFSRRRIADGPPSIVREAMTASFYVPDGRASPPVMTCV